MRCYRKTVCAFTLIELLVVVTLMSVAVGMVTMRFDGVSDQSRLQSTARQLGDWVHLAAGQARLDGSPRLLTYDLGSCHFQIQKPQLEAGTWRWSSPITFDTATRVNIERVMLEQSRENQLDEKMSDETISIRISSSGRFTRHAVLLSLHDRYAIVLLHPSLRTRIVMTDRRPLATNYSLLLTEVKQLEAA